MGTRAAHKTQDQNFNVHFDGSLVGGKNNGSKAQKKGGGLVGRKALNDISNSTKPLALQPSKRHNSLNVISIGEDLDVSKKASVFKTSEKSQVGGRKPFGDLTNSERPSGGNVLKKKNHVNKKLAAVEDVNFPSSIADEGFLHDHQKCIMSQTKALDRDYFMKLVGLDCGAEKVFEMEELPEQFTDDESKNLGLDCDISGAEKVFEMKELPEHWTDDESKNLDPVFGSPESLKPPYVLKDYDLPDFKLKESPKKTFIDIV